MEKAIWWTAKPLEQEWFQRDPAVVAQELIGKYLVQFESETTVLVARIVETEAYLAVGDPASHSYRGRTARNAPMFAPGGVWYVYRIYGIHRCVNVVTEGEGQGSAVLIRAAQPIDGVERMRERRNGRDIQQLLKGPANFAQAFGFSLRDNFQPVRQDWRFFVDLGEQPEIERTPRIGISKGRELLLRFVELHSAFRSR